MKKHRRTLVERSFRRIRNLWAPGRVKQRRADERRRFLFEPLESRQLLAGDLDLLGEGEGTAPTVAQLPTTIVLGGSPLWVSLNGQDAEGGQLTYTASSSNPALIDVTPAPQSNESLLIQVQGFGDMKYMLFDNLVPRVASRIKELVASGFYDRQVVANDSVQATATPTATTFAGSSSLSSQNSFYNGRRVQFTSGALNGQSALVTGYNGTSKVFSFAAGSFAAAPAAGDTFQVVYEIDFIRVLDSFVIQGGDPTNTGSGGSGIDFDDQFHIDLQHNRSGLLSMAKSDDDTNDSQFFITEERNESQYITLNGNPTGGTFTLTYFDQTTGPITFNNSGNFDTMATAIQTALTGLARIGVGNVTVVHDPAIDNKGTTDTSDDTIAENRRWRVDFKNALGHQEVINLTGNASGLTGGSSPSVSVVPQTAARFLDFNHSIFGVLTEGEAVRDAISNVTVVASSGFNGEVSKPTAPVIITNIDVIHDLENSALMLKAVPGQSGEADITVTVKDAQNNSSQMVFHVIVGPDTINSGPFLNVIDPVRGTTGQDVQIQLTAQDVEINAFYFDAIKPNGEPNYILNVDHNSGLVTITPPVGFIGTFNVLVGVRGAVAASTVDQFDTQLVAVTVAPTKPTGVDLTTDSGFSPTDNITNTTSLSFQITGVAANAVVKLKEGNTVLASNTVAAGNTTITLNVTAGATFGQGSHTLTATQTINGIESDASTGLAMTLDTTPPGNFTSSAPSEATVGVPLSYNANIPEEGTAGFTFSLQSHPSNATINSATGVLNWTPTIGQLGSQVFAIVATDAAGNSNTQPVILNVAQQVLPKIAITLVVTDENGNPLPSVQKNDDFFLRVYVQDVSKTRILTLSGNPTGGTFTLSSGGQTTAAISKTGDFAAMAASIQAALAGLSTIGAGNVAVTHDPIIDDKGTATTADDVIVQNNRWKINYSPVVQTTGLFAVSSLTGGTNSRVIIDPNGVSFVAFDVAFPQDKAQATGNLTFSGALNFFGLTHGVVGPGSIDEVFGINSLISTAALNSTPVPDQSGAFEVFRIPMKALQAGQLIFTTDANENLGAYNTVLNVLGSTVPVPAADISFGSFSILVDPTFEAFDRNFSVNEDSGGTPLDPAPVNKPGQSNDLTITNVGATNHGGTAIATNNGTRITYTPASNFNGEETFTYTVSNQFNESILKTIKVQVQSVNDPPDAVNDGSAGSPIAVPEDAQNFVISVLDNDTVGVDTNEIVSTLKVTAVGPAGHGTVSFTSTGVKYTPTGNYSGPDSFTYTIKDTDGTGLSDTATVFVNVTEVNDNPTAVNDTATVNEDSSANPIDVRANDSVAPDTDETITVTAVVSPTTAGGTVTANGTNVLYTPAPNFQGTDSFTYTITDSRGGTATATVIVTVSNVDNDPPTANNDSGTGFTAFRNTPAVFDVLANDSSNPDPVESLTIDGASLTQPAHGTVSVTNGGTRITYTPAPDYTGPDSFTYKAKDPGGLTSEFATVTVNVLAFIPSTLSGFVHFDGNNDGTMGGSESPIAGVTITLTGTDVNQTTKTAADGSYSFVNLAPGNYTITETQPAFTIDGKEHVGSQGGTSTQNDKIVITLAQNTTGTQNNFGELGRQATYITLSDFFASRSRNTATAAIDTAGNALWYSTKGPAWTGYTNTAFAITNSNTKLKVDAKNPQSQNVTASINLSDPRIEMLGTQGTASIYRLRGGPGLGLNFTVVSGGSGEGEGEGEGSVAASAAPATTSDQALLGYLSSTSDTTNRFSRLARPPGTDWQSAVDQALTEL